MRIDDMTLTLAIDQTNVKATIPSFMTQTDDVILPYTIGFVPWEWIEKSTYFKKISKGLTSAIPNNYFFYNPSDVISEQTRGVPFVYTIRQGTENTTCNVYDNNGTYTQLPYASNNANLRILHSFNTEAIIEGAANAGMQVNGIRLYYYGFEVLANEQGWLGNQINDSVRPIAAGSVYAQITPMPDIKLSFSANINSVTGGSGYTITEEIFNQMNDNGIVTIDGGTYESGGVSLKRTLYLFITSVLLEVGNSAYPGFGTMMLNNARCCGVVNTGGGATPTYFQVRYGQSRENQFITGEVSISTKQYPSAYGYYVDVPENGQCVFRWAVSAWINTFVSGGCTWNDILIMLLTAFPAYKINDVYYCAEFDDDYQLTGKFVLFENARDWQKNINPESNVFDYEDIPEPEPEPSTDEEQTDGSDWTPNTAFAVDSIDGFATMYGLTGQQLGRFGQYLWAAFWSDDFLNSIGVIFNENLSLNPSEILNYIISVRCYPFSLSGRAGAGSVPDTIYIGRGGEGIALNSGSNILKLTSYTEDIDGGLSVWEGGNTIPAYYGDFRDYEPCSRITVFVPFCGSLELPPSQVVGNRIHLRYSVDFSSGVIQATVSIEGKNNYIAGTLTGTIGATVELSASNLSQVVQKLGGLAGSAVKSLALLAIGSKMSAAAETAEELTTATDLMAKGGESAVSTLTSVADMCVVPASSFGTTAGFSSFQVTTPMIRVEYRHYELPSNYAHVYGYACNKTVTLSALENKGFTVCKNVDLSGIPATQDELNAIESLLTSGVYF